MNNNDRICRYCLEGESSNKLLIEPCLCSGSIRFVHKDCFLMFLNSKMGRYNWSNEIKCELCKYELNLVFTTANFNCLFFLSKFCFFLSVLCPMIIGVMYLFGSICEEIKAGCIVDFDDHIKNIFFSGFVIVEIIQFLNFLLQFKVNPELKSFVTIRNCNDFPVLKIILQYLIYILVSLFFFVVVSIFEADKMAIENGNLKREIIDILQFQNREITSSLSNDLTTELL